MRLLTLLWTMRRLWRDASCERDAGFLRLERGRHARKNKRKARSAERGLRRCSYARGGGGSRARSFFLIERPTNEHLARARRAPSYCLQECIQTSKLDNGSPSEPPTASITTHSAQKAMKGALEGSRRWRITIKYLGHSSLL